MIGTVPVREIIVATSSPNKHREIAAVFNEYPHSGIRICAFAPHLLRDIPAPEETGETFAQNARLKAEYYRAALGCSCLSDDSGLCVDALGGAPGIYSSRYAETEAQRIERLLGDMDSVPGSARTARFVCAVAIALAPSSIVEAEGVCEGYIAFDPRGPGGFGYDPVFRPLGGETTMAELTPDQKNAIGHRGQAIRKIISILAAQP